jgi:hypothetical protein
MSDLFSPPTELYAAFRLFRTNDGAALRWTAARSLEEAKALLRLNSFPEHWTEEVVPEREFDRSPSPACVFLRFRRGYAGSPLASILYSTKEGPLPPYKPLPDDPGTGVQGAPAVKRYGT